MSKLIVTTSWDDGSKLDLKLAGLLDKYGIKGTFYIPKNYLADPFEKDDLRALDKVHEIGAHTLKHVDLTKVSLLRAKEEIEGIKAYLEDMVGHSISMFCYPYGRYNEDIKKMVRDSGFIAARTTNPGGFALPPDPYEWQITLGASNGSPRLTFKIWRQSHIAISSLFDWELRAKLVFDLALRKGGVYHLWGHSWEFEEKSEWSKLEKVFSHISRREDVQYMTNAEIFRSVG